MPKDSENKSLTEVKLHLFGMVPWYRASKVERQLKTEDFRLRHEMLAAVREATPAELADPDLAQLRMRIVKVVNEILADAPIETIGFYDVCVTYR